MLLPFPWHLGCICAITQILSCPFQMVFQVGLGFLLHSFRLCQAQMPYL